MMQRSPVKSVFVFFLGLFGLLYLANPTMGLFELIPDAIPFVGNLDEAGASLLVIGALRYFGIDLTKFLFGREEANR